MAYETKKLKSKYRTPKQRGVSVARFKDIWTKDYPVEAHIIVNTDTGREELEPLYFKTLKDARSYVVRQPNVDMANVQAWDNNSKRFVGKRQVYFSSQKKWDTNAPPATGNPDDPDQN